MSPLTLAVFLAVTAVAIAQDCDPANCPACDNGGTPFCDHHNNCHCNHHGAVRQTSHCTSDAECSGITCPQHNQQSVCDTSSPDQGHHYCTCVAHHG